MNLLLAALGTLAVATSSRSTTETSATCSINDLNLAFDPSYLVSKGWKRPFAERLKKKWQKLIIDSFKREYTDPPRHKRHPGRTDGDHSPLLCSEFEVRIVGNEDAESYLKAYTDWAKNIFMR